MKLIIATNKTGYIGKNGGMLWHCKEDLKHFKELTYDTTCLVGRVTYEGLPKLKNRELLVVGKGYMTLEEALSKKPDWIIGGKQIYEQTFHLCDELHISIINNSLIGDTKAPDFSSFNGKKKYYYYC